MDAEPVWGVTALQAIDEMDAGPIWASRDLPSRAGRPDQERALQRAGDRHRDRLDPRGGGQGRRSEVRARTAGLHPARRPRTATARRSASPTAASPGPTPPQHVLRRIRAADGTPGVHTRLCGVPVAVFDAHRGRVDRHLCADPAPSSPAATAPSSSAPATARSGSVTCAPAPTRNSLATSCPRRPCLPNTSATSPRPATTPATARSATAATGPLGVLTFRFYNGAMSTAQCRRLLAALRHATAQDTRVLLLRGGQPFSNGIHLGVIDAAPEPGRRGLGQHQRHRRRLRADHHLR